MHQTEILQCFQPTHILIAGESDAGVFVATVVIAPLQESCRAQPASCFFRRLKGAWIEVEHRGVKQVNVAFALIAFLLHGTISPDHDATSSGDMILPVHATTDTTSLTST